MKAVTQSHHRLAGIVLACAGLATLVLPPLATQAANLKPVTAPAGSIGPITSGGSHGTTMYESYRIFPGGAIVPGSGASTSVLLRGSTATLAAPRKIVGPMPGTAYAFLFWDIDGHLYTHRIATFVAPTGQAAFAADAWYLLEGPGSCAVPTGCPTGVTTYGFSLLQQRTLSGTPIASVIPISPSVWTPPSATVWTTTTVTITAANPVELVRWLAPGAMASGPQLTVGAGVSTIAIAFYGPNPCQGILNQMASLSPGDFPPPNPAKEEQAYAHYLGLQLKECEARHGG